MKASANIQGENQPGAESSGLLWKSPPGSMAKIQRGRFIVEVTEEIPAKHDCPQETRAMFNLIWPIVQEQVRQERAAAAARAAAGLPEPVRRPEDGDCWVVTNHRGLVLARGDWVPRWTAGSQYDRVDDCYAAAVQAGGYVTRIPRGTSPAMRLVPVGGLNIRPSFVEGALYAVLRQSDGRFWGGRAWVEDIVDALHYPAAEEHPGATDQLGRLQAAGVVCALQHIVATKPPKVHRPGRHRKSKGPNPPQ